MSQSAEDAIFKLQNEVKKLEKAAEGKDNAIRILAMQLAKVSRRKSPYVGSSTNNSIKIAEAQRKKANKRKLAYNLKKIEYLRKEKASVYKSYQYAKKRYKNACGMINRDERDEQKQIWRSKASSLANEINSINSQIKYLNLENIKYKI